MNWIDINKEKPVAKKKVFLLIDDGIGHRDVIRAEYIPPLTVKHDEYMNPEYSEMHDMSDYVEEEDEYYVKEAWFEINKYEDVHWAVDDKPVAWMPLPSTEFDPNQEEKQNGQETNS